MFRKILAATRNPSVLEAAVLSAARIAEYHQALLTVLHVIEPLTGDERNVARHFKTEEKIYLDASGFYLQEVKEALYQNYSAILSPIEAYQVIVQCGIPWMEILKVAMTEKTDLLLLGTHLQKNDKKVSLDAKARVGSTTEGILKHERCPVMIVSKPVLKNKVSFEKILVCIDFSPSCISAFQFAVDVAKKQEAKLYLFHMLPVPPQPEYSQTQYEIDIGNIRQRLKVEFQNEIAERIETKIDAWGGVYPDIEILKSAHRNDVDLIVMGSHTKIKGTREKSRWYVGSAVERVSAKSDCPVTVITDPKVLKKLAGKSDIAFR